MAYRITPKQSPFCLIFVPCDEKTPENLPQMLIDEAWEMERVLFLIPTETNTTFNSGSC
jgi:hypothetical protein